MDNLRRLPDSEFDVMNVIWECNVAPVNTAYLMENVGKHKGWKAPTLISFLSRLEERGFIHSEKMGKERYYYADAAKEEYIRSVTIDFLSRYHSGSFVKMMDLMYGKNSMSSIELDEMLKWLQEQYWFSVLIAFNVLPWNSFPTEKRGILLEMNFKITILLRAILLFFYFAIYFFIKMW